MNIYMNIYINIYKCLICQIELNIILKHFPCSSKLHKIFNKNTVKVSYSCTQNMSQINK